METNKKNGKVICYLRSSTDKQEIESQRADLYRSIHADGYTDEQVIEVGKAGISACDLKDEYFQLFDDMERIIEEGGIKCVYVYSMTRLVRLDDTRFVTFCNFLTDHSVNLKLYDSGMTLLNNDGSYNFGMEVAIKITALVSKQNTKELKMQLKRGKERNKVQGLWNGGRVRYGYRVTADKSFEVDDEQASIVRRIYKNFLGGTSARQIAKQLYNEGIIDQDNEKSREIFVLKILKDPAYLGTTAENGTTIYEPLVTKAEQDEAVAKLKEGQKQPRRVYEKTVSYALGLLRTPDPAAKAGYYLLSPHRADNQYWTTNGKGCVNADLTDSLLLQVCNNYIREFSKMDTAEVVKQTVANIEAKAKAIKLKEERIAKLQDLINGIEGRLAKGKITEEYADKLQDPHRAEIKRLKAEINENSVSVARLRSILKMDYTKELDMYAFGDEEARDTIKKYIDYVNVERVKNGTYSYEIHFTRTDRVERYMIRSKAHEYQRWNGEAWEAVEIRMLNRYTDRRRSTPAAMRQAA